MNPDLSSYIQSLWNVSEEPFLIIERDGLILERSPEAERLFPSSGEIDSIFDSVVEIEALSDALEDSFSQKRSVLIERITIRKRFDERAECSLRISPLERSSSGEPVNFLIGLTEKSKTLDDLKELAKLNDERVERLREKLAIVSDELVEKTIQLAEEQNKILVIINGMRDALIGCDADGMIIQHNETAINLLTLPDEDLTGRAFAELCPEIAHAIHFDPSQPDTMPGGEIDLSLGGRDLRVRISSLLDEGDQPFGFVLIAQDRTEQAEIDRMKSDLISIVSHELRSPPDID